MIKEDVLQYLKENGYLVQLGNETIITNKFIRDVGARAINAKDGDSIKPIKSANPSITKEDYVKFIEDAEVPTFIANGQGGKFFANRVSKKGFDAFKVAVAKTDEKVLLAACKWYYKQNNTSRVMIGTWFSEDIWISCVNDIKKAMENRDKKTTVIGQSKDYGNVLPTFLEDNSSNMERG